MMLGSGCAPLVCAIPMMARALTTSSMAAAAVPALASKSSSGSLMSMLGFGHARIDIPLSEPLQSSFTPQRGALPSAPPKLEAGSLESGAKVVAVDSVSPVSAIALVLNAGAAYETDQTTGASKVLEHMAFKTTLNRSTFRLTRELEKIGATATATTGRDHIAYTISAPRINSPEAVEILLDSVFNARFTYWEVQQVLPVVKAALEAVQRDPQQLLVDVLHRAAFEGGLAAPINVDPALLDHFTNDNLLQYAADVMKPSAAVLAAAGVGLEDFKHLVNPLIPTVGSATSTALESKYVGGYMNVLAPASPLTWVGLGLPTPGGLSNLKGAAAAEVVQTLLDDSLCVLPHQSKESDVIVSAKGFSSIYRDTGLVGVVASSAPAQGPALVDAMVKKVEDVAKGVTEAKVRSAKQQVLGRLKTQLFSSPQLAARLASSLLLSGHYNPADITSSIESLTSADVTSYVSKALKSGPTLVTYGNLSAKLPRYDAVAKRLGA